MLKNENIICISSIDWDFIWQGHQEIMATFAKNGNHVLFIENTGVRRPRLADIPRLKKRLFDWLKSTKGFRKEADNLFIYSPVVLPFPYAKICRWINKNLLLKPLRRWMKITEFYDPIIWTFLPTGTALDIINNIEKKLLVYYCIADFSELVDDPKKITETENEIIKKSDIVFAQGIVLKDKCARLNSNVHIFPFGVKLEVFNEAENGSEKIISPELNGIKHPVVGYVGGIHRHIDFDLLETMAKKRPEWSIVMIGPEQTDISRLRGLKNVFVLGKKEFSALPSYIAGFDACIIPYEINGYTKTVFPTKLNEYHAMGKPVVSTGLPEVINFNRKNGDLVMVATSTDEFITKVHGALQETKDSLIRARIESASKYGWTTRVEEMSDLIGETIEQKSRKTIEWQESFVKFYRSSRAQIAKVAAVLLVSYLVIFHTSIVWWLAGPLKISQEPEKADCIVVFAGGVGESGKAGQGYEERVGKAVELYKNGYAEHIIFSSGYTYYFKEPLVMRALAVSLGVSKSAIILEDKSRNTYDNVKLTKAILDRNGWGKVLLVSSPYNMLRSSLVFGKVAKDTDLRCMELNSSRYYTHKKGSIFKKQISLKQIKGIIHEYLGIIYYWMKGYI